MRTLYQANEANYPRLATDAFFVDYENNYRYNEILDETARFVENFQLLNEEVWSRFVNQFKEDDADSPDNGWRGEYWGKMMRGACFVYSYTKNEQLYAVLKATVLDILTAADEFGRISSYHKDHEFNGWDMWCRKYVLLGMQYFLEICPEEDLKKTIIASMCRQADYIISKVGKEEDGKLPITATTHYWRGLNACSLLEPIVRLYTLTQNPAYFNFAEYIVNVGATDIENIFLLAEQDELYPYQYPVTKAYEMISCFEGLLEFYRITGISRYKTAVVNFANRILESDFTVIGSCGCTHELFDHSTVRQTNTQNHAQQETCVTVTLMKFFYQLTLLTGDARYSDAFEVSLYNAYLGSVNTAKATEPTLFADHPELKIEPLPFDSYSPLTLGRRGLMIGGFKIMSDLHYYGCCACIGSAGIGLVPKMQLLATKNGFAMNLYINGSAAAKTASGNTVRFETETQYPKDGTVKIKLGMDKPEQFELLLRIPAWSEHTCITCNGQAIPAEAGYVAINREFADGDVLEISLDMRTKVIRPVPYGSQIVMTKIVWPRTFYMVPTVDKEDPLAKKHVALQRGPIMLAKENRLGYDVEAAMDLKINADGTVDTELIDNSEIPYTCILGVKVPLNDGSSVKLSDYSSAGKLWTEENKMAVWLLTK